MLESEDNVMDYDVRDGIGEREEGGAGVVVLGVVQGEIMSCVEWLGVVVDRGCETNKQNMFTSTSSGHGRN
ncbi:unnamed protein product [Toxocara canis]|uniref:Uncharacterized protein n=1 Tax=Toxocara canis TaxID=6265 RepID=A0A183UP50_TOXCA|nr:unnamed protein product [Toxocara canis]